MALGMWSGAVTRSGKCKQDRLGLEMLPRMVRPCPTFNGFISVVFGLGHPARHEKAGFAYHLELQVAGILSCSRPVGVHCHDCRLQF